MWNRKTTLENKLKRQKWNRNLRKKIAEHNKEIESYAFKLEEKRWDQKCDELEKNMSRPNTWQMLRHLIDPTNTKTHANIEQIKARYKFDGTDEQLIDRLKEIYIGPACAAADTEYQGAENPLLDESILVAEPPLGLLTLSTRHHWWRVENTGAWGASGMVVKDVAEMRSLLALACTLWPSRGHYKIYIVKWSPLHSMHLDSQVGGSVGVWGSQH
ncbi:hypothetical protein HPB49_019058 [Dermacentor silvarum]|uniref:Uncharacterized protein n=1 Tax=Dermacentor silvarum TaxID=543639 RepID=A0ACB8CAU0_DERSI|nr:hypothetical protein HPB49_019058 [Dermacentor silvarum]